jgi:Zn-dependent M28 family amino/carboxypeptidase
VAVASASALSAQKGAITADELMSAVRVLASPELEGRGAGTPGGLKARAWVAERFSALGLKPIAGEAGGDRGPDADGAPGPAASRFELPFRIDGLEGANIAGICAGTRSDARWIVVSAHYDHVGIRNGSTFVGADDNASGVAVLLAIADRCRVQPYSRPVLFVAFDAEERRLTGSRAFVQSTPVPLARVALNINLDMVARGDKGELYAAGTHHTPALRPALDEVAKRSSITLLFGHDRPSDGSNDWTMQSDHGSFHRAGVPFVYFGVEDHPDYHKPTDTADKIDPRFFAAAAATILDAVRTLDRALP